MKCPAALLVQGEHYPCELDAPHDGLAHSNAAGQAIWVGNHELEPAFAKQRMRVGRTIGRSLYLVAPGKRDPKKDRCIGMVDTPGVADIIAARWSWIVDHGYKT